MKECTNNEIILKRSHLFSIYKYIFALFPCLVLNMLKYLKTFCCLVVKLFYMFSKIFDLFLIYIVIRWSLFQMKIPASVSRSSHQHCGPCYLHLPIFSFTHTLLVSGKILTTEHCSIKYIMGLF